jgi:hypothetical protein
MLREIQDESARETAPASPFYIAMEFGGWGSRKQGWQKLRKGVTVFSQKGENLVWGWAWESEGIFSGKGRIERQELGSL